MKSIDTATMRNATGGWPNPWKIVKIVKVFSGWEIIERGIQAAINCAVADGMGRENNRNIGAGGA